MKTLRTTTIAFFLSVLLIIPNIAFAHSALVSTVPSDITDTEVSELHLTFKEGIEPVSKVEVTNEAGEEQALSDIKVKSKEMTAVFETPLTNGVYTVSWKIISADGHPLNGSYSFEVKMAEPTTTPAPTQSSSSIASATPSETVPSQPTESAGSGTPVPSEPVPVDTPSPSGQSSTHVDKSESESSSLDITIWIIVIAVILLIVAAASAILKKKKE